MHITEPYKGPLTCSQCGSTNIMKPINDPKVELQCMNCGHTKESQESQINDPSREFSMDQTWTKTKDDGPPSF